MAFGFGCHFCLGNSLARLELAVMFDRLLTRLPDLALVDDAEPALPAGQLRQRLRVDAGPVLPDAAGGSELAGQGRRVRTALSGFSAAASGSPRQVGAFVPL